MTNSLGDFFSQSHREAFAATSIDIGTILKKETHFSDGTSKIKYSIIVGKCADSISIASVVFNSEINLNIQHNAYLQSLQHTITTENYPFLKKNSHVDCTEIFIENFETLKTLITNDPTIVVGTLKATCLAQIHQKCSSSKKIPPFFKKKFGLIIN